MKKFFLFSFLFILCITSIFYTNGKPLLPLEKRTTPYAAANPETTKKYAYYTISDESGLHELMRIPLLVHIGDEILAADNRLYRIIRIDEDHAYARFIRKVKL